MEAPAHGNRIAALDGWRGIAILMVLADHLQWQWTGRYTHIWSHTGQHGVTLFFVLSGYLITSNLLKAEDLKTFYIRRFFRLMPVAWTFLALIQLLSWIYPVHAIPKGEIFSCLFFYRNYFMHVSEISPAHFWSLSVEEQFYVIWPATLLLFGKRKSRWLLGSICLGCEAIRIAFWNYYDRASYGFHTEVRADALCIGCLLAIALSDPKSQEKAAAIVHRLYLPALAVFVACVLIVMWLPPLIESCAIAVLIAHATLHRDSISTKILSSTSLIWLGQISYSMYVWQAFFMIHYSPAVDRTLDFTMPVVVLASYLLIEKPFTELGRRITTKHRAAVAVA